MSIERILHCLLSTESSHEILIELVEKYAKHGNLETFEAIRYMLEHGTPVDTSNNINETPMSTAIEYSCADVVRLLIDHGANLNMKTCYGTSLDCAVSFSGLEIVKLISDNGGSSSNDLETLRQACLHTTDLDVVKVLVEKQKVGGDWITYIGDYREFNLLESACNNKCPTTRIEIFRYLAGILKEHYTEAFITSFLNKRNATGCTTIMYVSRWLDSSDVETVISMGANPYVKAHTCDGVATALDYAIFYQKISSDTNTILLLLELGCTPNYNIKLRDEDAIDDTVNPKDCSITSTWMTQRAQRKLEKFKKKQSESKKRVAPKKKKLPFDATMEYLRCNPSGFIKKIKIQK